MSPIVDIQRRMRELGRIRLGTMEEYQDRGTTKRRPTRLTTFRLTSASRALIEHAAVAYGGVVEPWADQGWQVTTDASSVAIFIPPGEAVSQWWELWSGAGCSRRCDGQTNVLEDIPCQCPGDHADRRALAEKGQACKPTTRLNVMLVELPDIGLWRLESHGFYAAQELAGAADALRWAADTGRVIPARLRADERVRRVPGQPVKRYVVPVIEFTETRLVDMLAPERVAGAPVAIGGPVLKALPAGRPELPSIDPPETSDFRAPMQRISDIENRAPTRLHPELEPPKTMLCGSADPAIKGETCIKPLGHPMLSCTGASGSVWPTPKVRSIEGGSE